MDCQDARLLLAFNDRPSEPLDAAEGQALQQHLEACPDCAQANERRQADAKFDHAIGAAMCNVPIPTGQPALLKQRLAADRPKIWKRWAAGATAAAAVLAVVAFGVVYANRPTDIAISEIRSFPQFGSGWTIDQVDAYFREQGLDAKSPREFDYSLLQNIEIVVLHKRQVAKLTFSDGQTKAHVLVLSHRQFRVPDSSDDPSMRLLTRDGFSYVIFPAQGRPEDLARPLN